MPKLQVKVAFYTAKLAQAEKKYTQIIGYLETQTRYFEMDVGPEPEPRAFKDLKKQKAIVENSREKLAAAKAALAKADGSEARIKAQAAAQAERAEKVSNLRSRLAELGGPPQ